MMAFSGAGAVLGATIVAWMGRSPGMQRTALVVQVALGLVLVAFASSLVLTLSYALLILGSLAVIMVFSLLTSLVRLAAPDAIRGRVMSIYMVAFCGGMPIGSLAAGWLAAQTSVPLALAINGAALTVVIGLFAIRGRVFPPARSRTEPV